MQNKSKITLLSFLLLLGLKACITGLQVNNQAEQEQHFINYFIQYSEKEQQLLAEAIFKTGDSTNFKPFFLEEPPLFIGKPMTKKFTNAKGVFYTTSTIPIEDKKYTFSFKDYQEETHPFEVDMKEIEQIEIPETLSKEKGGRINFKLDKQHISSLNLLFIDKNNKIHVLELGNKNQIEKGYTINRNDMRKLPEGVVKCFFIQRKDKTIKQEGNYIFKARIEYTTNTFPITIIP